jgi:hypothetical protein
LWNWYRLIPSLGHLQVNCPAPLHARDSWNEQDLQTRNQSKQILITD